MNERYRKLGLDEDAREKLDALMVSPSPEAWGRAYCLVLGPPAGPTLWQAVAAVDPWHTPSAKPGGDDYPDEWTWAPEPRVTRAAISWAAERTGTANDDEG